MSLQTELEAAKAEVTRLEAEVAALPAAIVGKTEAELSALWHAIGNYFKGSVPPVV
jgi:Flp pilus assembly pilin Flp